MPTVHNGGRFVWGSACGSSAGGAMPTITMVGVLFGARPSAGAQEGQSSPATTSVVPGFAYLRGV